MASSGSMGGKSVSDDPNRVNPKRPGRRKMKGIDLTAAQKIKKPPQRGLGVAELERLRLQEMGSSSFRTPFTSDPAPVEVPAMFPPGFGPTGYGNVIIPGHYQYHPYQYQNPNPYGSDHFPHPNLREYLGSRKSMELPSIPSSVFKMKHINGYQDFLLNKSTNENINKGMVVEHQFFPTEMGSADANNSVEIPSGSNQNDGHTRMLFINDSNTIDLSLKL